MLDRWPSFMVSKQFDYASKAQARFSENFMFQLVENEMESTVTQNAIPSKQHIVHYHMLLPNVGY